MPTSKRQNATTFPTAAPVGFAGALLAGARGSGLPTRRAVRRAERQLLARCDGCLVGAMQHPTARANCASCRARIARHAVRLAMEGASR